MLSSSDSGRRQRPAVGSEKMDCRRIDGEGDAAIGRHERWRGNSLMSADAKVNAKDIYPHHKSSSLSMFLPESTNGANTPLHPPHNTSESLQATRLAGAVPGNCLTSMRSTLIDIAREAGVSSATVDRVLNNRPGVRTRTREVVTEVARRMGYIASNGGVAPADDTRLAFDFVLPAGTN